MICNSLKQLKIVLRKKFPVRIYNIYSDNHIKPRGHVLVSYLAVPLKWSPDDRRFLGHSNCWECVEIVRILNCLGFIVDVISWDDTSFVPRKAYTAVLDIHQNLTRYVGESVCKIFYLTGSHPTFSNNAEQERLDNLQRRRDIRLKPRRTVTKELIDIYDKNLASANCIALIGNEETRRTFPENMRENITTIGATGSVLNGKMVLKRKLNGREFIWYNGVGAVHKGLDLVLEVFSRHPDYVLHVVGPYMQEKDFVKAYRYELCKCPNIRCHKFLYPSSRKFQQISENVIAFISPSCSEGISTAAITCMQYGMIPVISKNCGISLEKGMGYVLCESSFDEIEHAVNNLMEIKDGEVLEMMKKCQDFALQKFSRSEYSRQIELVLRNALKIDVQEDRVEAATTG